MPRCSVDLMSSVSERVGDVSLDIFPNRVVNPAGRLASSFVVPSKRFSGFRRLGKLSGAVAALRKLLKPVLVLVMDRGRSCRLGKTLECLCPFSSPFDGAPGGVDEVAASGDKLLQERLKAAINLKGVGECSRESGFDDRGEGISMLVLECSTNGISDRAAF